MAAPMIADVAIRRLPLRRDVEGWIDLACRIERIVKRLPLLQ